MKKNNSKVGALIFLLGVLVVFLLIGSLKEGATNQCKTGYYASLNDSTRCCSTKDQIVYKGLCYSNTNKGAQPIFDSVDTNKDSKIDSSELLSYFKNTYGNSDSKKIDGIINSYSKNKSTFDESEFAKITF